METSFDCNLLISLGIKYLIFATYWQDDNTHLETVYGIECSDSPDRKLQISPINCHPIGNDLVWRLHSEIEDFTAYAINLANNKLYKLGDYSPPWDIDEDEDDQYDEDKDDQYDEDENDQYDEDKDDQYDEDENDQYDEDEDL